MQIIDYEQKCLELKIFNRFQIETIRLFFMSNLGSAGKDAFDFEDFGKFIQRLLSSQGSGVYDQNILQIFFKTFDSNGDNKLDWNEYIQKFVEFIHQCQRLFYLKQMPTLKHQKEYLNALQIAFFIYPFQSNSLNFIQTNLLQYELLVSSNKILKPYHYLSGKHIQVVNQLIDIKQLQFKDYYTYPEEFLLSIKNILIDLLSQRLPTLQQFRLEYSKQVLQFLLDDFQMDFFISMLCNEEEYFSILALENLTLIVSLLNVYNIDSNFCLRLLNIGEQVMSIVQNNQGQSQEQAILLLGHLCLWDKNYISYLLTKRDEIMRVNIKSSQTLLYHSWFLSCLFQRYSKKQVNSVIQIMNEQQDISINHYWIKDLNDYFNIQSKLMLSDDVTQYSLNAAIHINLLNLICPFYCTNNMNETVSDYILNSLKLPPNYLKISQQALSVIKSLFKYWDNINMHIRQYVIQQGLFGLVFNFIIMEEQEIAEQASKLLLNTISYQNSQLMIRYLTDNSADGVSEVSKFLKLLTGDMFKIAEKSFYSTQHIFKQWIIQVLVKFSIENQRTFEYVANQHLLLNSLWTLLLSNYDFGQQIFNDLPKYLNLNMDDFILLQLKQFYQSYNLHVRTLLYNYQQVNANQLLQFIDQIAPNQMVLSKIESYTQTLFQRLQNQSPIIMKRYLRSIYQSLYLLTLEMLSISSLLLEFLCSVTLAAPNQKLNLQLIIQKIQEFQVIQDKQKEQIDDLILIASSGPIQNGSLIVIVYLNQYKNDESKCKIVIKENEKFIDFEKEVQKELNISTPMIYLAINQNSEQKLPFDASIIDDNAFRQFKTDSSRFVDTAYGSMRTVQEIIAVDLLALKKWDFSMKKMFEVINHGSKYQSLRQIQNNQMLWFLENSSASKQDNDSANKQLSNRSHTIQQISSQSKLRYDQIENLLESLEYFYNKIQVPIQYPIIIKHNDFIDYLSEMSVPFQLGKRIAMLLARNGLNNPIEFTDFVCFVAIFIQNLDQSIIMKFVYLLYLNENSKFGYNELLNYLGDMFEITKCQISSEQLQQWGSDLLNKIDSNQDGYISFLEYYTLLCDPQFKAKLLEPLLSVFNALTFRNQNYNVFSFKASPLRLF